MAKKGIFYRKRVVELLMQNGGAVGEKKVCGWGAKGVWLTTKKTVFGNQKACVFSPFCCDNLIKWNIKCVIFRVRKRGEKDEGTLRYCKVFNKRNIDVCQ